MGVTGAPEYIASQVITLHVMYDAEGKDESTPEGSKIYKPRRSSPLFNP